MKMMFLTALAMSAIAAIAAAPAAATKGGLELVGGSKERPVVLFSSGEESLEGSVAVGVGSTLPGKRSLAIAYYPTGAAIGEAAGSISFAEGTAPVVEKGKTVSFGLSFSLPADSQPSDLEGTVVIRSRPPAGRKGKRSGGAASVSFQVKGEGSSLAGVSIRPSELTIQLLDERGFLGHPDAVYANVQLAGPGVPSLLQHRRTLGFNLLLRSDHGDVAHATITDLAPGGEPTLATATLRIRGDLQPGKFEGKASLSSLSPESPSLSIKVESGDLFIWPLLFVFLGTLVGGGLYLASNRSRRKALLRDQVKSILQAYQERLDRLQQASGREDIPIWSLASYLGHEGDWYRVKWNAIDNFDGAVQTIWSEIHWARNDADLDQAGKKVESLCSRLVRWMTAANGVGLLQGASRLEPAETASHPWEALKVTEDTKNLLELMRQVEPPDDKAATALADRVGRQAHWHVVLAHLFHAYTRLDHDITRKPGEYSENDKDFLRQIDIVSLDKEGSPELSRTVEKQIELEQKVRRLTGRIQRTYQGDSADLELVPMRLEGEQKRNLALLAAEGVYGPIDTTMLAPNLTEVTRPGEPEWRYEVRGTAASAHNGDRIPVAVKAVLRRDLLWSIAIALVSSAFYLPTLYTATWGTTTDYISAFAAGFIGKAVISWAALPLFQSLRGTASKPAA